MSSFSMIIIVIKLIMVIIAARLGALGFLSLSPEDGNLGLRDQALALSWVSGIMIYLPPQHILTN